MCVGLALAYEEARERCEAAGFTRVQLERQERDTRVWVRARRARTLPDWIRPRLRLLICGLNPSLYAADAGVPFARPGNRFWGAARAARLIVHDRDPFDALSRGIGFTDCAKRATRRASELRHDEYAAGLERLERQIQRYRPQAICFVGLDGWRRVRDRHAVAGWVTGGFGGRPAYLMPSTSGLNAHCNLADLTAHLRRALRGP
ncbi:MAG: mismatch-specific DNA-glycosylase [Deltaproteobacteria bacterium]|nr:MAG: mismatch-specific DNA-glycosylase [Deltaproteobacteria bacterium]